MATDQYPPIILLKARWGTCVFTKGQFKGLLIVRALPLSASAQSCTTVVRGTGVGVGGADGVGVGVGVATTVLHPNNPMVAKSTMHNTTNFILVRTAILTNCTWKTAINYCYDYD